MTGIERLNRTTASPRSAGRRILLHHRRMRDIDRQRAARKLIGTRFSFRHLLTGAHSESVHYIKYQPAIAMSISCVVMRHPAL